MDSWSEWIKSAENRSAYEAVVKAWQLRGQLVVPDLPSAEDLAADSADDLAGVHLPAASLWRARRRHLFATAAAVLVICAATLYSQRFFTTNVASPQLVVTGAQEKKEVVLDDGSHVWLGNSTMISVQFGPCMRNIDLRSGEALFDVAHNPSCPFVVSAGSGTITAVGTQFSVRRTLDLVTVRVAEGAVDVKPREVTSSDPWQEDAGASKAPWTEAKVAIGEEVAYRSGHERSAVEPADPRGATAWLQGRREYRHEPLAYVVTDINRYFGKHIEVSGTGIGDLQFTGRVYESEIDEWLRALETIFPVEVVQGTHGQVVIQNRDASYGVSPPATTH
jgi:transmembrane sensor